MKDEYKTRDAPSAILHPLRTLIVDDSVLLLSCLRRLLEPQDLVHVVDTAANGSEALRKADALTPDLVLMDVNMPRMNGLQAAEILRRLLPNTRIIIMTLDETVETKTAARAHGADGFVGKRRIVSDLMPEIRRVFRLRYAVAKRTPHEHEEPNTTRQTGDPCR